jgi:Cdc6-like AAA superfamily ATPase
MENFPRVGFILISTSEAEIRGLVGRRLFSRLRPEYCEFMTYNANRFCEIAEQRIKQAYEKLVICGKLYLCSATSLLISTMELK